MVDVKLLKSLWMVGAMVSIAAIPLLLLARKKPVKKGFVPQVGDEWDIFTRELSDD